VLYFSFDDSVVFFSWPVFSFSFGDRVVIKRQHYGKKKTTLWSKEKDNTMVKRKRQQCGQKKKTTLWSKEKDNTMVKRKIP
jgi:hypothetical protein